MSNYLQWRIPFVFPLLQPLFHSLSRRCGTEEEAAHPGVPKLFFSWLPTLSARVPFSWSFGTWQPVLLGQNLCCLPLPPQSCSAQGCSRSNTWSWEGSCQRRRESGCWRSRASGWWWSRASGWWWSRASGWWWSRASGWWWSRASGWWWSRASGWWWSRESSCWWSRASGWWWSRASGWWWSRVSGWWWSRESSCCWQCWCRVRSSLPTSYGLTWHVRVYDEGEGWKSCPRLSGHKRLLFGYWKRGVRHHADLR